jgi:orotate phosphoribosyltransferase-like protein
MSLETAVKLSASATQFQQLYEDFEMIIDIEVPALVRGNNPAIEHSFDMAVAEQIAQGASTYREITQSLGISTYLVVKAAKRQNIRPTGRRKVDPFSHPRIDLDRVRALRKAGMTFAAVARELNVCYATLQALLKHVNSVTGETWPRLDPLNHPMVNLDRVRELQKAGMALGNVARELKVSTPTLRSVLHRASAITREVFKRTQHTVNPLDHPTIDLQKVRELRKAGTIFADIARQFNVSAPTLVKFLKQARAITGETFERSVPPSDPLNHPKANLNRVRELHKEGKTTKEIAVELNILPNRLYRILARVRSISGEDLRSRLPLDQSEVDLDRARQLRKAGMSFTKIASELNIPRHRLYFILRQITLTTGETFNYPMPQQLALIESPTNLLRLSRTAR